MSPRLTSPRLTLALLSGDLALPETGCLSVLLPLPEVDLHSLPQSRVQVVQPFRPHFDHFRQAGFDCVTDSDEPCAAVILCLPRAKAQARAMVQVACARSNGLVIVDGVKTDGIDSIYKDIRKRVTVLGQLTKAHGRIFWFDGGANDATDDFADWQAPKDQMADGYHTAPGVFSADAIDPASRLLADALPKRPGRHVADLGAGWGYLSARMLAGDPGIETLDLVEADHAALICARANVTDPRARFRIRFHWADALDWAAPAPVDGVVMNPPFHTGRSADPSLGRGFIATASRILVPGGTLWMVANRHLPYEAAMAEQFADVQEIAGDTRFKVLRARRPIRAGKDRLQPARSRRSRANR